MRQILEQILSSDPAIEVIGTACDPFVARDKIKRLEPDVLTLDVEMPRMDGLTFLEKLMQARPMPVLMVSSLTEKSCETTIRALELGAVDIVTKPKIDIASGVVQLGEQIIEKVKIAASARVKRVVPRPISGASSAASSSANRAMLKTTDRVICIGASTGGTEAILEMLTTFPPDAPGTVITLHMPPGFTNSFARRLDGLCQVRVSEARNGDRILPGHVLIAPGGYHMGVTRAGALYSVNVGDGEPVNRHKPSVDILFRTCAKYIGGNAIGIILTGMGNDGAAGLLAMKQAGAYTIAQDEATCVVYGMPNEAVKLGAVNESLPIQEITARALTVALSPTPVIVNSPRTSILPANSIH
jgi:two-component system, chemotaxis family, protein-glutamate methylesterase/glutaminase